MKKALPVLAVVLIFVLGLGIMLYPAVANYLNAQSQTVAIDQYEEAARANTAYYEGLLEQAQAFNEGVLKRGTLAVMTEAEKAEYNSLLNLNGDGVMGYIEIPKLDLRLSIAHGTDEDVLQKMVGHVEGTSLPVGGESTHAVLSAHRGLPTAKLFSDLDLMQVGDRFTIYTLNQALTYQVDQITVILPEEIEALAIEPGKDYVTLMTVRRMRSTRIGCWCAASASQTTRLHRNRRVSWKRSRSMRADCCKMWCCLRRQASCL